MKGKPGRGGKMTVSRMCIVISSCELQVGQFGDGIMFLLWSALEVAKPLL